MTSWLPQTTAGFLPAWIGLIGGIAVINGLAGYFSTRGVREVYSKSSESALAGRLFSNWTLTNGIIRVYAAYHLDNPQVFELTLWTFAIALCHFGSELLYFKTSALGRGSIAQLIIAPSSLVWMLLQRDHYLS